MPALSVADRLREGRRRRPRSAARRVDRARERGTPRPASGGAAGSSSRAAPRTVTPPAWPEELGLDMARTLEVALAEHGGVAERRLRLAPSGGKSLVELARGANDAHPAAAAAGGGLDHEREADLVRRALGKRRHAGLARDPLRCELVAAEPKRLGRRARPSDAGSRAPRRRSRRSRRGSRSRDGSHRRLPRAPRARAPRRRGTRRSRPSGRRIARGASRGRPAPRRRRSRSRAARRCGRRGARSLRGWRRGACGSSRPALYADVRGSLARGSRSDGMGTVTGCAASAS